MYVLLRHKCLYKTLSGTSLKIKYLASHFYLNLCLFFPYIIATKNGDFFWCDLLFFNESKKMET